MIANLNRIAIALCCVILMILSSCKTNTSPKKKTSTASKTTSRSTSKSSTSRPITTDYSTSINAIANPRLRQSAKNWLGTPYKYGGTTKTGVDCSGLSTNLYKESYQKALKRSSGDQYTQCIPISRGNLKEGDLVFFKIESTSITHVGVYVGMNKFIHASTSRGVIVSDLNEAYYSKYFFSGGRLR